MQISECFEGQRPVFSFEFFPPKTDGGIQKLFSTIDYLAELKPDFVSITYGAGGGTRATTAAVASHIKNEIGLEPLVHLTCVGHDREDVNVTLEQMKSVGVENILALRGDPPKEESVYVMPENGFAYASELTDHVRRFGGFNIGGACYPEGHVENPDKTADLEHLKEKVAAGAKFLITNLFFDNAFYFDFVRRARAIGITVPIHPGLMPVTNYAQVTRFTAMCGASIPQELLSRLDRFKDDEQSTLATGIEWAIRQGRELLQNGAPGLHFYTLNKSLATRVVCASLKD